jgi:1-acyl-sn-glycerol-3-phosphate acyltransferase
MKNRIEYLWRLVAIAGCYAVFYASALVFIVLVLPVIRVVFRNSTSRNRKIRWIINKYFIFFVQLMIGVGVMQTEIYGADQLKNRGPRMVIANHPSYLDIVILLSLVPNACCIVNSNLLSNPFIGLIVTSAGFICNKKDSEQVVNDCISALNSGCPVIVFPEGTRSVPGRAYKFHRGFAHIVLKSGFDIQPVTISCEPSFLAKGVPWYKIPEQTAKFIIHAQQKMKASDIADIQEAPAIAARKVVRYLECYYAREMGIQ